MRKQRLPYRWAYKHGAYYYRPRNDERALFGGKSWYRLGSAYHEALAAFAAIKRIEVGETLAGVIDRYRIEILPRHAVTTQDAYGRSLDRLSLALGHNHAALITPFIMYQYRDALITAGKTMNTANADIKVMAALLDRAVQWGVVSSNAVKGEVKAFGERDGLKKARTRYVEDWELSAWQSVASEQQKAFAAIVMLTGARKGDVLRLLLSDIRGDKLRVPAQKTGSEIYFRITPALQSAIDLALACRHKASLYLFNDRRGKCMIDNKSKSSAFDLHWAKSMARAIVETALEQPFTRHDLRAKVGSDADTESRAQELLGHSSAAMTRKHYRRNIPTIEPAK